MQLMNVIFVSDMRRSVAFYEAVGLKRSGEGEPDGYWNEFPLESGTIALHLDEDARPLGRRVDLMFGLPDDGSLDRTFDIARVRGLDIGSEIRQEDFGRVFWLRDPDGLEITFMDSQVPAATKPAPSA